MLVYSFAVPKVLLKFTSGPGPIQGNMDTMLNIMLYSSWSGPWLPVHYGFIGC